MIVILVLVAQDRYTAAQIHVHVMSKEALHVPLFPNTHTSTCMEYTDKQYYTYAFPKILMYY